MLLACMADVKHAHCARNMCIAQYLCIESDVSHGNILKVICGLTGSKRRKKITKHWIVRYPVGGGSFSRFTYAFEKWKDKTVRD